MNSALGQDFIWLRPNEDKVRRSKHSCYFVDSWNNKTYAVPPRVEVESSFSAQYIQNSSEAFRAEASLTSNFSGSQDISESPGSTISQSGKLSW